MFSRLKRILQCVRNGMTVAQQMEDDLLQLCESAPVGLAITDLNTGRFLHVNCAFQNLIGYSSDELLQMTYDDITPSLHTDAEHDQTNTKGSHVPCEKQYVHKTGQLVHVLSRGIVIKYDNNKPAVWSVVYDITEAINSREMLRNLAFFDQLTGIPNRAYFINRAEVLIDRAKERKTQIAFLILDIDEFSRVNGILGHRFGDNALIEVASRLTDNLNANTATSCFCARTGGDEFAIMIENFDSMSDIETIAEEICRLFDTPIVVDDQQFHISVTIGASMYPTDAEDVVSVMRAADLALHAAKNHDRGSYNMYATAVVDAFAKHQTYERAIVDMVNNDTIDLHFQPIYDIKKQKIVGAEALLRTDVAVYGTLDLQKVIEVAEQTGLIVALGELIFRRACKECMRCINLGPDRIVSVNISLRQVIDHMFVDTYQRIMAETGADPKNMALEITESLMMTDEETVPQKLRKMQDMGMKIYIDDFGKGFSSMSHLHTLPADKLKIDMAFITKIGQDNSSVAIVRGINTLAHSLGMTTCAEGVETEVQMKELTKIGVDQVQGYLIGKPVPMGTFKWAHIPENSND